MNAFNFRKSGLVTRLFLSALVVSLPLACLAGPESEDQLIQDLASPKAGTVTEALQHLQKEYPASTKALPVIKNLLTDPRVTVKRKAARVLGELHAPVDEADVSHICGLLKAPEPTAITDGLKALRGLQAPEAVPDILPLLHHPDSHIIRDACRTLAVLGNKDLIPKIEPLLQNPLPAVQKDAADAIAALKAKS